MTKASPLLPSFSAGEVSERLHARTDFAKYPFSAEKLQNLIPLAEGGAMRRSGTRYVAEAKSSAVKGRLLPFEFSVTQAYMLELGANSMRFYRHQGQIVAGNITASITNGTFDSNISGWTDQSSGSGSIAWNSGGYMDIDENAGDGAAEQEVTNASAIAHVLKFRVIGVPADNVQGGRNKFSLKLRIGTASGGTQILADTEYNVGYHCVEFTATAANFFIRFTNDHNDITMGLDDVSLIDNVAIEIGTPWAEADLARLSGPQSADVLYLFHPNYPAHKLLRFGHSSWSLEEIGWLDGPYLPLNTTSTTLSPSATGGAGSPITVTASAVTGINDNQGFLATDVGRLVRIDNPASGVAWGWGIITAVGSTTSVTVWVSKSFSQGGVAVTRWRLGAWSGTTGYASVATFFEQRLYVANTSVEPDSFWASQTSDFENFKPDDNADTVEADDALDYTIASDKVEAIRWMRAAEDTLAIGTVSGEWVPSSTGAVITPLDITVRTQTTHGSSTVEPVRVDHVVLFVQRSQRKLREFGFDFNIDSYRAVDMTRLNREITYGGLDVLAFQEEPDSLVWAVRNDGKILSMTYRREEDVVGWAPHIIGGVFGAGNAVVESVAVIPGANGGGQTHSSADRDEVWVIVKRTINGGTKRYVEFFERHYEDGQDIEDAVYLDSCITYDSTATTSISGLDHLEGETVAIWADGDVQASKTVSSGSITIDTAASTVQIGLAYTHSYKSLRLEAGAPTGTAQNKTKRIFDLGVTLMNSDSFSFGPSSSNLTTKSLRSQGDDLVSGEYKYQFEGDWITDPRIVIESSDPAPFTMLALQPEIDVQDVK